MSELVGDVTMSALHTALSGLSARQRATADNIANVNTPGFLARRVDFESSLQSALQAGADPGTAQPVTETSLEPTRLDGNNVNLDEETLLASETQLRYQLLTEAMTDKFARLRTAIGGGA